MTSYTTVHVMADFFHIFFTTVCSISPICLRPYVELVQKLFTTVRCICDYFLPVFFSDISTRVELIPCIIPFFFSRLECTLLLKCTLITKKRNLTSLILISESDYLIILLDNRLKKYFRLYFRLFIVWINLPYLILILYLLFKIDLYYE